MTLHTGQGPWDLADPPAGVGRFHYLEFPFLASNLNNLSWHFITFLTPHSIRGFSAGEFAGAQRTHETQVRGL